MAQERNLPDTMTSLETGARLARRVRCSTKAKRPW